MKSLQATHALNDRTTHAQPALVNSDMTQYWKTSAVLEAYFQQVKEACRDSPPDEGLPHTLEPSDSFQEKTATKSCTWTLMGKAPSGSFNLSDGSQITECWTLGSHLSTKNSSLSGLGGPVAKPLHSQCRVRSQVWSLVGELDATCRAKTKSLYAAQPPPPLPPQKKSKWFY